MSHTPEPWHNSDYPLDNTSGVFTSKGMPFEDWKHAVRCVNGCAGLNPAAYRELLAAAELMDRQLDLDTPTAWQQARHALKDALVHATGGR